MNTTAGLWIDHRKTVIVIVSARGEETIEIKSNVDKQPGRFAGVRSTARYESQLVKADDRLERKLTGHLNQYYAKVIAAIQMLTPFWSLAQARPRVNSKNTSTAKRSVDTSLLWRRPTS